jgi:hypothetical protein
LSKATKDPKTPKFLYLPTNPYEDLLGDMLECGIAIHSRVSLAVPREIDDGYTESVQAIEHLHHFEMVKDILETNRSTIADADCILIDTHKYVVDDGVDPNQELKHFVADGLKQLVTVESDTTWLWVLGIAAVLLIVVAVAVISTLGWTLIGIGLALAIVALAAYAIYKIGSDIYYRMTRTVAKRTATLNSACCASLTPQRYMKV